MTDWHSLGALAALDDAEVIRAGAPVTDADRAAAAFHGTNEERGNLLAQRYEKELVGVPEAAALRPTMRAYAALVAVLTTPHERFETEGPPEVSASDLTRRAIGAAVAHVVERVTACHVNLESVEMGVRRDGVMFRLSRHDCRHDMTCEVEPLELLAKLAKTPAIAAPAIGEQPFTISMRTVPLLRTGALRGMVAWAKPLTLVTQETCFALGVQGRRVFGRTLDVRPEQALDTDRSGDGVGDITVTMQDDVVRDDVTNPVYMVGNGRRLLDALRQLPTLTDSPTTPQHARRHAMHMAQLLATGAAVTVSLR